MFMSRSLGKGRGNSPARAHASRFTRHVLIAAFVMRRAVVSRSHAASQSFGIGCNLLLPFWFLYYHFEDLNWL